MLACLVGVFTSITNMVLYRLDINLVFILSKVRRLETAGGLFCRVVPYGLSNDVINTVLCLSSVSIRTNINQYKDTCVSAYIIVDLAMGLHTHYA